MRRLGKHASQRTTRCTTWLAPQVYIARGRGLPRWYPQPAGLHTAVGFITAYYGKSPEFPVFAATPQCRIISHGQSSGSGR